MRKWGPAAVMAVLFSVSLSLAAAEPAKPAGAYRLHPGDKIQITVAPQKEYDCDGVILPDGMLYLKIMKEGIKAAGMTIPELSEVVRKALDVELVEPLVTATVAEMAPPPKEKEVALGKVTVVGAVAKSGALPLEAGLRVRKALDLMGGTVKGADLKNIVLHRADLTRITLDLSTDAQVANPAHNRILEDGDSIEVPLLHEEAEGPPVRIGGEVGTPGPYDLKKAPTLQDLIAAAGKLTTLADIENIQLQHPGQPLQTVNLEKQYRLGLRGKVPLQAGDEVFVPPLENTVILLGMVPKPGYRPLKPGQTIRDFFVRGGEEVAVGLNGAIVDLKAAQLMRTGKPERKIDLAAVLKREDSKDNVVLETGDVIFLPPRDIRQKRGVMDYLQQLGPLSFLFGAF